MNDYSTSSRRRQAAVKISLKETQITAPERAEEIRKQRHLAAALEYYHEVGEVMPDDRADAAEEVLLGYCIISPRKPNEPECYPPVDTGKITVYANEIELSRPGAVGMRRGQRGEIKGRSHSATLRLLRRFNRLHWPNDPMYFTTLTHTDDFPDFGTSKDMFQAWTLRMMRRFPGVAIIWTAEYVRRKSGNHRGEIAPHYHMFVFHAGDDIEAFTEAARDAWTDIAGQSNVKYHLQHGTKVDLIHDRKQAVCYVTKYMNKSEGDAEIPTGRTWGVIGEKYLDFSPLQVLRVVQAEIVLLRQLMEAYLLQAGHGFWLKLRNYAAWMGFHVYGVPQAVIDEMLREILGHTGDIGTTRACLSG